MFTSPADHINPILQIKPQKSQPQPSKILNMAHQSAFRPHWWEDYFPDFVFEMCFALNWALLFNTICVACFVYGELYFLGKASDEAIADFVWGSVAECFIIMPLMMTVLFHIVMFCIQKWMNSGKRNLHLHIV